MRTTGPVNILCVDDDPHFVDVTATFLRRNDERFSVATATACKTGSKSVPLGTSIA